MSDITADEFVKYVDVVRPEAVQSSSHSGRSLVFCGFQHISQTLSHLVAYIHLDLLEI